MTKKDYELIADSISKEHFACVALKEYHESVNEWAISRQYNRAAEKVYQVAINLSFTLKLQNDRFDSDRFLKACTQRRPHHADLVY